jgi:hypothetical protein
LRVYDGRQSDPLDLMEHAILDGVYNAFALPPLPLESVIALA